MSKKAEINARANQLLKAWLAGMNRGGHTATPEDIAEVFETCVARAEYEVAS